MNQFLTKNIFEKNSLYGFSRILEIAQKNMKEYPRIILKIQIINKFKTKRN